MPVTRSSTRPSASAVTTHTYSLRSARPTTGFYTEEVDEEMHAAAVTLLSLRSGNAIVEAPVRRSTRIANRS